MLISGKISKLPLLDVLVTFGPRDGGGVGDPSAEAIVVHPIAMATAAKSVLISILKPPVIIGALNFELSATFRCELFGMADRNDASQNCSNSKSPGSSGCRPSTELVGLFIAALLDRGDVLLSLKGTGAA
jgi:hypothetical protein